MLLLLFASECSDTQRTPSTFVVMLLLLDVEHDSATSVANDAEIRNWQTSFGTVPVMKKLVSIVNCFKCDSFPIVVGIVPIILLVGGDSAVAKTK